MDLYKYGNSIIQRMFKILDLTKMAKNDNDFKNIERFIEKLIIEIEGSSNYYSEVKYGNQLTSVVMKLNGIKTITDYNVRKAIVLDSIEIVNRIIKEIP